VTQAVAVTWLGITVSTIHTLTETSDLTQHLVAQGWEVCDFQDRFICTHTRFRRSGHTTSYIVVLVMVDTECLCGHSDRGGDDATGTASHYWVLYYIDRDPLAQLRRASSNYSSFVLIRVVRLTIETNALTGTCLSEKRTDVHLTSCLAALAVTALVLYAAFPVSWTEKRYDPPSDPITSFTE